MPAHPLPHRHGRKPVDHYRIELGLYTLGDAAPRWRPTPLVAQYQDYIAQPAESVGWLGSAEPALTTPIAAAA